MIFSHDDILRGNVKDVFVYGAIIGFNDLQVCTKYGLFDHNSLSNEEKLTLKIAHSNAIIICILRYMQKEIQNPVTCQRV